MRLFVCSVFDSATEAFGRPIFVPHVGQALRGFSDEVRRSAQDNDLFKHSDDFVLYLLGEFDDSDGRFHVASAPTVVVRGKDVLKDNAS